MITDFLDHKQHQNNTAARVDPVEADPQVTTIESGIRSLSDDQIRELCADVFEQQDWDRKRILAIIPDHTRTALMDRMFPIVYDLLEKRVNCLDVIIALGTHPPLSMDQIYQQLGIDETQHRARYVKSRFFNHEWKNPKVLTDIGSLSASQVDDISQGRMSNDVSIQINRRILEYDVLLIIGPTFPHEVVGFSGGNKYLFPGISGPEIIDMFHWLGALITTSQIIGVPDTPVRRIVDAAAALVPVQRFCLSLVIHRNQIAGIFPGTPEAAWQKAARLSEQLHIRRVDYPYRSVLSHAPAMYDELWTGGKCMYKLEPVVADGGELIIYAPHIQKISETHGDLIEKIGYHVRDYFVKQPDRFQDIPGGIKAHSTHVKGSGTYEHGIETPRIHVTLATGIPKDTCHALNLGYRDPDGIDIRDWQHRESEGLLYVPSAGEILYRLNS